MTQPDARLTSKQKVMELARKYGYNVDRGTKFGRDSFINSDQNRVLRLSTQQALFYRNGYGDLGRRFAKFKVSDLVTIEKYFERLNQEYNDARDDDDEFDE